MKVLKFGGTSIGTAGNIRKVKEILSRESGDVLVVVSALGGVTDQILLTARMAASGKRDFHPALGEIRERHRALIRELYPGGNGVDAKIEVILRELE